MKSGGLCSTYGNPDYEAIWSALFERVSWHILHSPSSGSRNQALGWRPATLTQVRRGLPLHRPAQQKREPAQAANGTPSRDGLKTREELRWRGEAIALILIRSLKSSNFPWIYFLKEKQNVTGLCWESVAALWAGGTACLDGVPCSVVTEQCWEMRNLSSPWTRRDSLPGSVRWECFPRKNLL